VKLILGCVPLLVIAGIIEAFVSPLPPGSVRLGAKFVAGGSLFVLLLAYLAYALIRPERF
jgi:K+-transporting ATPase KdpF subunit